MVGLPRRLAPFEVAHYRNVTASPRRRPTAKLNSQALLFRSLSPEEARLRSYQPAHALKSPAHGGVTPW